MRALSKQEIAELCELVAQDAFCADPADIAQSELRFLDIPKEMSTLEYSVDKRYIPQEDGTKIKWRLDVTPYLAPIMAAMDRPEVPEVIVPKPGRSGGTVVAENFELKRKDIGPFGNTLWYLAGPGEVSSYAEKVFKPLFEGHEDVASKIGTGQSDNKLTFKRINGFTTELLAMSSKTLTNRQAGFIFVDESDSLPPKLASSWLDEARLRQRMLGTNRKIYGCSHPDIGWSGGIAQAWLNSSRGIFIMACAECGGHGSPYPSKHWKDIPRFKLHYQKSPERTPVGDRLKRAGETAAMLCPHCGALLDEDQRKEMVAAACANGDRAYMHDGQSFDLHMGVVGEMFPTTTMGFWIHALMVTQVSMEELAKALEGAKEHHERTKKTDKLRKVTIRTMGEVYEGAASAEGFDAEALRKRAKPEHPDEVEEQPGEGAYHMGQIPDGVLFVTAAVDVGGRKFDVLLRGWDLERRSWLIDRFTIRQRRHPDGVMRDIHPTRVVDDWMVLEAEVIDRLVAFQSDPTKALPVAVTTIDTGDGNATWLAYEFARRMDGKRWAKWQKVRCIKGKEGKRERVPTNPTKISKDSSGKQVTPEITLHVLGVDDLKRDTMEDLAVIDGSPGHCEFAIDTPREAFDEFFNEAEIEGSWVQSGPNETLDLYGYTEAGRIMLEPDRQDRKWEVPDKRPMWARPVSLSADNDDEPHAAAPATPKSTKQSLFDRFDKLNKGGR